MHRADAIHRAIQHIYEATLAPENWPAAIASVAQAGCAHKAILHAAASNGPNLAISSGFRADDVIRLRRELEHRLPDWIEAIPTGTALRQTSAISDAEFRKSDLYNIAVRPAGGFYGIVAPLVRGPDHRILLAIARNAGAADFTAEDVRATSLIGSHLVTALKVWQRIADSEGRASAAFEAIERLNSGVVLLDEKMRPLLANPCAEALARSRDGLLLEAHRLSAIRPDDAKNLDDAIASATRFGGTRRSAPESATLGLSAWKCMIHRNPPQSPLVARVIPVGPPCPSSLEVAAARTIVFIMEPDRPPAIDASSLSSTFGFTLREAALAAGLVQGADLRQAARQMNIGIGTARSYLKRVLSKTDTHRQAELVSFLLRTSLQSLGDHPAGRQNGVYDRNG